MAMPARVSYDPLKFVLSIVIAIVAATAALWAALRLRGLGSTLGAAAIMGVAVSGMHYTGMAAIRTWPPNGGQMVMSGASGEAFLLPLIVGVSIITFVLIATIALSPTEEEISAEAELMRRIDSARSQPARAPRTEIGRSARHDQNAGLPEQWSCARRAARSPVLLAHRAPQGKRQQDDKHGRHQPPGRGARAVAQRVGQREPGGHPHGHPPVIADHEVVCEGAEGADLLGHSASASTRNLRGDRDGGAPCLIPGLDPPQGEHEQQGEGGDSGRDREQCRV
jgi:Bacterial signalling protein N terminal repeat